MTDQLMVNTNFKFTPIDAKKRAALDLRSGDTIRVWQKIKEKDKYRLQAFEGLVLSRKHGNEAGGTFTVRKTVDGVGVEKIFPLYSPLIDKIEVLKRSKVRQAKLYHIRRKAAKEIKREMSTLRAMKQVEQEMVEPEPEKPKEAKEDSKKVEK